MPNALSVLGIDDALERRYQAISSLAGRSQAELAELLGVEPEVLAAELETLEQLGLVSRLEDGVEVRHPAEAFFDALDSELRQVRGAAARVGEIRSAIPSLRRSYRAVPPTQDHPLDGEVRIGGNIPALFARLIDESAGDLCWLRPDQWAMPHDSEITRAVAQALAAGRGSRALYPVQALELAPDAVRARADAGEQVRITAEIPTRMAIFGHTSALLQESFGVASSRRLLVREAGLLDAVQALFDTWWAHAIEVPSLENPEQVRRGAMRQLLLRQLADGAKDERIARSLGLSLRTVRRRVAELMTELGVETRFQLGVEATRRGWV